MRLSKRIRWNLAILVAALAVVETASRLYDPATPDERAILTAALHSLQPSHCEPAWTSGELKGPVDERWIELEMDAATAARLKAGSRRARARDTRLLVGNGLIVPVLGWLVELPGCYPPIRVGTPAISGNLAFVAFSNGEGTSRIGLQRTPQGWEEVAVQYSGVAHVQY